MNASTSLPSSLLAEEEAPRDELRAAPYEPVDVELMPEGERQALNAALAAWWEV